MQHCVLVKREGQKVVVSAGVKKVNGLYDSHAHNSAIQHMSSSPLTNDQWRTHLNRGPRCEYGMIINV